jgi:YggT family protein
MGGLISVGYFLFNLFFSLVLFALWLRILFHYFRVSALQPISQVIHTFTNPIVKPINSLLRLDRSRGHRFDWSCIIVVIIVECFKYSILSLIMFGKMMPISYLGLYVLVDLVVQPCNLLFYAVVIRAIMSWINPGVHHPIAEAIYFITEPLLKFARRYVPPISGFDFSPILIVVLLMVITLFMEGMLPMRL